MHVELLQPPVVQIIQAVSGVSYADIITIHKTFLQEQTTRIKYGVCTCTAEHKGAIKGEGLCKKKKTTKKQTKTDGFSKPNLERGQLYFFRRVRK